ncbi:helix-turn-helix domain-containing protein [Methylophaga nitratireducenticrescens]|uniref:helix-turn-helix domain-containing protein n=1 Tax=Methylophaga nitratireducenticrescens TaxID=754476 RepID=UPI00146B6924|nr:helix-turn-helix transcriptional regulator [Methylophaga nitratireducenticrescens]
MKERDISVCNRFSSERKRLKKSQGFVADACDVSEKTVGRWEKSIPIPSDKLSLLAFSGFDMSYVLTGERSYMILANHLDSNNHNLYSNALILSYSQHKPESPDQVLDALLLAFSRSDSKTAEKSADQKEINDSSNTYGESDLKNEIGSSDPIQKEGIGSIYDPYTGSGKTLSSHITWLRNAIAHGQQDISVFERNEPKKDNDSRHTIISKAELSSIGKVWWDAVSELSQEERNAVLTLVFDHVIAKFIELNTEKVEGSDKLHRGAERLSSYLNTHGPFRVDNKKSSEQ